MVTINQAEPTVVIEAARKLLVETGTLGLYPVPVGKIADKLGYTLFTFDPEGEYANVSGAVIRSEKKILINGSDGKSRQRFTIAHELGHIRLYPDSGDKIDYRIPTGNPTEKEEEMRCNQFAAALLMDAEVFAAKWIELKGRISALAEYFGVNKVSIGYRASNLGIDD